ncbi:hypothetical protein EV122DRAFT_221221, partial [Schizophyllum commune]
ITVGGICLSEFGVEIDEDKGQSSAWVPSKPGWVPLTIYLTTLLTQSFIVHWQDLDRTRTTSGRIELDGKDYGGTILRETRDVDEIKKSSVNFGATEACPFHFANLEPTGGSSLCCLIIHARYFVLLYHDKLLLKKENDNIGSITLKIWRVCVTGQGDYTGNKASESINCQRDKRAKNDLEYAIRFGDVRSALICGVEVVYLDEPIATFTFRYRGLDTRCDNGIVEVPFPISRSDTPARAPPSTSPASPSSTPFRSSRKRRASALGSPEPEDSQNDEDDVVTIVHLEKLQDEPRQVHADWLDKKRAVEKYRRKETRAKLEEVAPASSGEVADLPEVHE